MSPARSGRARRYPLHVTLTFAFTAILLLFGGALIGFGYMETREIALLSADRQMERVESHLSVRVRSLYGPVQNVVDVASMTLEGDIDALHEDLGLFTEVLRIRPDMSSVFVGYDDGSFFLVRTAQNARVSGAATTIPPGSRFVAQRIRRDVDPPSQQLWFLADDLRSLETRTVPWTGFDPRDRDWYREAGGTAGQIITEFYRFFTTQEIGVTIARRLHRGAGVVGADVSLEALSRGLAEQRITPGARLAMFEPGGRVVALSEPIPPSEYPPDGDPEHIAMPMLGDLDDPVFRELAGRLDGAAVLRALHLDAGGVSWIVSLSELPVRDGEPILLANLVPRAELLTDAARIRDQSALISIGILLVALLGVMAVARHVSSSLRSLAGEAGKIRELRFDGPVATRSSIEEVDQLADTMDVMKSSLQRFLEISRALSIEKRFDVLLDMILDEVCRVSGADGGAILLRTEDGDGLEVAHARGPASAPDGAVAPNPLDAAALDGQLVRIDDAGGRDCDAVRARFAADGFELGSILCVPLRTQQDEVIGHVQLAFGASSPGDPARIRDHAVPYIEALSSSAAVALDNRRLIRAQRELLDSFIHVVAGAIDAKSPYTHGHCQRVPEVARMLAEAAHGATTGPLADFRLDDDEWYELHLASWLHDCGKVTTPEYVVDKATKLETIHNRIHEVRTRCEVLWRDAEIEYYRALAEGAADETALRAGLQSRLESIRQDFEFIASCNLGDSPLDDGDIERLRGIAGRTWKRNLDDRLGLSHLELRRREADADPELPIEEPLLSDRREHVVPRPGGAGAFADDPLGFRMEVPENLYDHGELYNLSIRRGTLTAEERFKINEHVIQTIRMLGRLPFPREMRRVPDWAGNHHEKLDGTGYPRELGAADLSVPERIMAIADIFEALTSSDRPYMEPRPLDQAIRIMRSMAQGGHLCPDLLTLFLDADVHVRYARAHMRPEQLGDAESA